MLQYARRFQEEFMHVMRSCCGFALLLAVVSFTAAQEKAAPATDQKPAVTVKHVPITQTAPDSGKEMFTNYCAVCHGKDGKGNGPAASALKASPTDLTALAEKNNGKFPSSHVAAVIRGQAQTAAHGSQDMPVWGPLFSSLSQGHESQVQQRIANLNNYLETLQVE
jgi:mono/diheme cytochrome c family protein